MSASKQDKGCEACGKGGPPNDEGYCLACEWTSVQCDGYAQEVLLAVLQETIERTLTYVSPLDVFDCVHRALTESGCDGAESKAVTLEKARALYARRIAAGVAA